MLLRSGRRLSRKRKRIEEKSSVSKHQKYPDKKQTSILNDDVLLVIFEYADPHELLTNFSLVCSHWNGLLDTKSVFEHGTFHLFELPKSKYPLQNLSISDFAFYVHSKKMEGKDWDPSKMYPIRKLFLQTTSYSDFSAAIPYLRSDILDVLHIRNSYETEDSELSKIKHLRPTNLSLRYFYGLRGDGLRYLKDMPLKSLDLEECVDITDCLKHLRHSTLESLNLRHCRMIFDQDISHLVKLPLRHLNLGYCNVTDRIIPYLQGMTLLETLDITYTAITVAGKMRLMDYFRRKGQSVKVKFDPLRVLNMP